MTWLLGGAREGSSRDGIEMMITLPGAVMPVLLVLDKDVNV